MAASMARSRRSPTGRLRSHLGRYQYTPGPFLSWNSALLRMCLYRSASFSSCANSSSGTAFQSSVIMLFSLLSVLPNPRFEREAAPKSRLAPLKLIVGRHARMFGCVWRRNEPRIGKFAPAWKLNPRPRYTRMKYKPILPARPGYHDKCQRQVKDHFQCHAASRIVFPGVPLQCIRLNSVSAPISMCFSNHRAQQALQRGRAKLLARRLS